MHVNEVKIRLTWKIEEILTSVFEERFSEVESLTEQQKKAFSVSSSLRFCGLPLVKKKVAADKHVFAMLPLVTLTRLTAIICMKVRLKVKVTRGFPLPPCRRSLSHAEKTFKKNFWTRVGESI